MTTATKRTIKKLSLAEKVALVEKAKKTPFPMSDKEVDGILDAIDQARDRGDRGEVDRLTALIPISWQAAVSIIEVFGVEELLEMGLDLRYAQAVLGESFVYGRE